MGWNVYRLPLIAVWQREFAGYSWQTFQRDALAGITVGAVALPLALAFGVASGADAAAGLVTAILAGSVIAALGGGATQISGPTGAMSAILIVLGQHYGLHGIWTASLLAGLFLVLLGLFRLGRYVSFIPSSVIAGFTSGIALIIAIGQLDNVLGVQTPTAESALEKLLHYALEPPVPDGHTLLIAGIVITTMVVLPRLTRAIPGSLVGIILASLLVEALGWPVPVIGAIPRTLLLENRLTLATVPWSNLMDLIPAAISIAALGAIESLLCGAVGSNMTGVPLESNQELIGQGLGNMVIPFFGGVPATAAIARTSVAIKSGGVTRVTSLVHAGVLVLSVFVLSPFISQVPLSALGGVLLVTAWRMNEWETIHFFQRPGMRHALVGMLVTMLATVSLDLTQAILIGIAISALIYLRQSIESVSVTSAPVDPKRLRAMGHVLQSTSAATHVYYLAGPLFFGSVHTVLETFASSQEYRAIVINMRGVPMIDAMGIQALTQIVEEQQQRGCEVYFSGLQPGVQEAFARSGLLDQIGAEHVFWSTEQAIITIDQRYGAPEGAPVAQFATPFPPDLRVADVMTRDVYSVEPTTPVIEIVTLLLDHELRFLPIVDEQRCVVGVITDGDLLRQGVINLTVAMKQALPLSERAALVLALEAQTKCAADVLTPNPVVVTDSMTLSEAAHLLMQHNLKRLPVVNEQGQLVGILSRDNVLETVAEADIAAVAAPAPVAAHAPRQVSDVMHRQISLVQPATPLVDVLDAVLASPHHRVVVVDEQQQVIGLITDGDVLKRSSRQIQPNVLRRLATWFSGGARPTELAVAVQGHTAAEVMTRRVVPVAATTPILPAIQQLVSEDVVGMPVIDDQQRCIGWVGRMDLLHALLYQGEPAQASQ